MAVAERPTPPEPAKLTRLESSLWSAFAKARDERSFVTAWLALLAHQVGGVVGAVVLRADANAGSFVPVAVVPDPRRDMGHLRDVAQAAIADRRGTVRPQPDGATIHVAYPVERDGAVGAVVVLEVEPRTDARLQEALRAVHWASGWLATRLAEARAEDAERRVERAAVALDLVAVAEEHPTLQPAAMAVVAELAARLDCDRVAIGLVVRRRAGARIRVLTVSHAAWFRRRSALVDGLENAMDEAFDQAATVAWPAVGGESRTIAVAHRDYARLADVPHLASVVLPHRGQPVGILTLERRHAGPFDIETLKIAEAVGELLGPILDLKRRQQRWLAGRLVDGAIHVLGILLGPRRLSWKLLALALITVTALLVTVPATFRVPADARLEGAVQRAAVAPFDGYVAEAPVRAGDVVEEGALLVALDDRDLRLEALRWASEGDRLRAQQREAMAAHDRAQVARLAAQVRQADAQRELTEQRLARTRIAAPMAGLVVSGDLSQRLGSPVQAGEVLFELAPVDRYRVVLFVDERDLRYVAARSQGRLTLTGMPESALAFTVNRLTPMTEPKDGRNRFRLEASLDDANVPLRPGMEGVGKIDVDRRPVGWIWTRRLVDWVRQTLWTWWP